MLAILLGFYTLVDDTSQYVAFLTPARVEVVIKSYNISNSADPHGCPKNYNLVLKGNDATASDIADADCKEIVRNTVYPLAPGMCLNIVKLSHSHINYEVFLNLCGRRELWVGGKKIGEHTFPPKSMIRTINGKLDIDDRKKTRDGHLLLTMCGDFGSADRWFDQTFPVLPDERYFLSFYVLMPRGAPRETDYFLDAHDCKDVRYYKRIIKERTYKLISFPHWRRVEKVIVTGPLTTNLKVVFRIENEFEYVGDMMIRDFSLIRRKYIERGP